MGKKYLGENLEGKILIDNSLGTFASNILDNVLAELSGISGGGTATTYPWTKIITIDTAIATNPTTVSIPTDWTDLKIVCMQKGATQKLAYGFNIHLTKKELEEYMEYNSYGTGASGIPIMTRDVSWNFFEANLFMDDDEITFNMEATNNYLILFTRAPSTT